MTLFAFGGSLVIGPVLIARANGVRADDDFIRWMAKQPLANILLYRCMSISGFLIAGFGALLNAR